MKAKIQLTVVVAVFFFSGGFTSEKNLVTDEKVTLQDAEKWAFVKSTVVSNGHYSGDCIDLTLTNTKGSATKILVPAGTVFIADNAGEQNILVTNDIICLLKPRETKSFDISGYCCEHNDSAPDDGSTFKTNLHSDEKVKKLVAYMKDKNYTNSVKQDAVWCVANGSSVSNISLDDEVKQKELRKFVCDLTGQTDTWYTTPQNHVMTEERRIVSETVEVNGMLSCTIEAPMDVSNEVYDAENKLVYKMPEDMTFPMKGTYDYQFRVKITGWEKGKYYVLIKGNGKELLKQEFEI